MAKKKKKKNDAIEAFKPAIGVGLIGTSSFLIGGALQGQLPAGVANPLTAVGTSATSLAGPLGTIGGTGLIVKQLKKLKGGNKL